MGVVVVIDGRTQAIAQFLHKALIGRDMAAQFADSLSNLFGGLFDLQATQTLEDGLEISHETGRADDDDVFVAESVLDHVPSASVGGADLVNQQVVIDGLARDEHEGKIHRAVFGADVFGRLVDPILEIRFKEPHEGFAPGFIFFDNQTVVVLEAKLRIDGQHDTFVEHHDGVTNQVLAVVVLTNFVLEFESFGRQDVFEHRAQVVFAEHAALLGILQDVLEGAQLIGDAHDLLVGLFELGQVARDLANQLGAFAELALQAAHHQSLAFVESIGELALNPIFEFGDIAAQLGKVLFEQ